MAMLISLKKWRHYLYGKKFFVYTDHESLKYLFTQKELCARPARWLCEFQEYNFEVLYKQGATQLVPDMLSRMPMQIVQGPWQRVLESYAVQTRSQELQQLQDTQEQMLIEDEAWQDAQLAVEDKDQPENRRQRASAPPREKIAMQKWGTTQVMELSLKQMIKEASREDPLTKQMIQAVQDGQQVFKGFQDKKFRQNDGMLMVKEDKVKRGAAEWKWWIPQQEELLRHLLFEHHDTPITGHPGRAKTLELIRRRYFWPNMAKTVEQHVKSCPSCQRQKPLRQKSAGLLQPIPFPQRRWQSISMDFVGPMPETQDGHNFLLVVMDRLTHRCVLIPTRTSVTTKQTALLILQHVIRQYGPPETIVSDRDARFVAQMWREVMKAWRT